MCFVFQISVIMSALLLLTICFVETTLRALAALYVAVDTVGGLMFVPTGCRDQDWVIKDGSASPKTQTEVLKQKRLSR